MCLQAAAEWGPPASTSTTLVTSAKQARAQIPPDGPTVVDIAMPEFGEERVRCAYGRQTSRRAKARPRVGPAPTGCAYAKTREGRDVRPISDGIRGPTARRVVRLAKRGAGCSPHEQVQAVTCGPARTAGEALRVEVLVLLHDQVAARRLGLRQRRWRRDLELEPTRCEFDHNGLAVTKHRPLAVGLDAELAIERRKRPQVRLRRPVDSSRRDTGCVPNERAVREPWKRRSKTTRSLIRSSSALSIGVAGLRPLGQTPL